MIDRHFMKLGELHVLPILVEIRHGIYASRIDSVVAYVKTIDIKQVKALSVRQPT